MEPNPLEITVDDGKYTVVQTPDGMLKVYRHGEECAQYAGNNLVLCLAQELDLTRVRLDTFESVNAELKKEIDRLQDDLARAREGDL